MKKRNYKQNCSLALASDVLCERWTLLVFRELLIQPCRFKLLHERLAGMGTNLLTSRLKELEADGLICKPQTDNKRSAYKLTERGLAVEPIVCALIRWGYEHLEGKDDYAHYDTWDLVAMKALFNPKQCKRKTVIQFESAQLTAWVQATPKQLTFELGQHPSPCTTLAMTISQFQQAIKSGEFTNNKTIRRFAACFPS